MGCRPAPEDSWVHHLQRCPWCHRWGHQNNLRCYLNALCAHLDSPPPCPRAPLKDKGKESAILAGSNLCPPRGLIALPCFPQPYLAVILPGAKTTLSSRTRTLLDTVLVPDTQIFCRKHIENQLSFVQSRPSSICLVIGFLFTRQMAPSQPLGSTNANNKSGWVVILLSAVQTHAAVAHTSKAGREWYWMFQDTQSVNRPRKRL